MAFPGFDNVYSDVELASEPGCHHITRKTNGSVQHLFMWEWDWDDDTMQEFTAGCAKVVNPTPEATVKCPMCRTVNQIDTIKAGPLIKGLDTACPVCLVSSAQVIFPSCAHIATCHKCFVQLIRTT